MIERIKFIPYIIIGIILISLVAGIVIVQNFSNPPIDLQELEPKLRENGKPVHQIIVFNASGVSIGLSITLRNLQAIVNSQRPNGTMLFIVDTNHDLQMLYGVYGRLSNLSILQFNTSGSLNTNVKNLLSYFSFLIKGYVIFDSADELFIPAVMNFVTNYANTIAIPYTNYGILPGNLVYLEMYSFINQTDSSNIRNITNYYQNQIKDFSANLHGINIWNQKTDGVKYFDFVISQKYFSFPSELLNGSFSSIKQSILDLTNRFYNKPLLNEWPEVIPRISVPLYNNISEINDLSFYSTPLLFTTSPSRTFQEFLSKGNQNQELSTNQAQNSTIKYSLLLNEYNNSIEFLMQDVIGILLVNQSYFDNITLIVDDSVFALIPDLMYWILAVHPKIHIIPRIKIGTIIQPVYFPNYFTNQTAFLQMDSNTLTRNDWKSENYQKLLLEHFKGVYVVQKVNSTSVFSLNQKIITFMITTNNNISQSYFRSILLNNIQNTNNHNFVISLQGTNEFIFFSLWAINQAMEFIANSNQVSFENINPNILFNYLT